VYGPSLTSSHPESIVQVVLRVPSLTEGGLYGPFQGIGVSQGHLVGVGPVLGDQSCEQRE
jgi:hypothetical protein